MPIPLETDWLLQTLNTPVNLFNDLQAFDEMVERCKRNGYEVHEFDCRKYKSQEDIFNAILHSVGDLAPEHFYKNIKQIQFWDLFYNPWGRDDCKALMAFRNFDSFHAIDPECAQYLMNLLASKNHQSLQKQTRFVVAAHSENAKLELEPVLVIKAIWNERKSFAPEEDVKKLKNEQANAWWNSVMERLKMDGLTKAYPFTLAVEIWQLLGLNSYVELHEAGPSYELIAATVMRYERAEDWWKMVMERFHAQSQVRHRPAPPIRALKGKLSVKNLVEIHELRLPFEEILRLLNEYENEELERRKTDPRYLDNAWHTKVQELFNARSGLQKSINFVYEGLNQLAVEGKERPNRLNSTPEEAVEILLNLDIKPRQGLDMGIKGVDYPNLQP